MVIDARVASLGLRLRKVPSGVVAGTTAVLWAGYILYARLGSRFSLDLRVYRAGTKSLIAGHNPYHLLFTSYHLPFTYPPVALFVLSPLSLGPVQVVETVWWLLNAAAVTAVLTIAISSALALDRKRALSFALFAAPVLSLAFEPLRSNTDYGQINMLLLLLVLFDITRRRPARGGGVLVGLAAAIKLTPLVYFIYFALARNWAALRNGIITFIGLGLAVFLVLPAESKVFWFHEEFDPGRTGPVGSARNQSWYGVLHRWPFPGHGVAILWCVIVALTVAVGADLVRRLMARDRVIDAVVALGLTGELVSPISWSHHWVWIALIPVLLVRGFRGQPAVVVTMWLLALVAVVAPYAWSAPGMSDSLTLAGGLVLVSWLVSEERLGRVSATDRCPRATAQGARQ